MVLSEIRYQIFLSSTYDDLREERQQATQAILEMGHMPAGMELFPATDFSQWELIKRVIDESDYYIVIVGARYGSVDRKTGLSFTEMEYDYAISKKIPIMGFVREDPGSVAARFSESDPEKKKQLESFREKILTRHCRKYTTSAELGLVLMKSLTNEVRINPQTGWIRADQARSAEDVFREKEISDELRAAKKKIVILEREIRDGSIPVEGLDLEDLARGDDPFDITVLFQDSRRQTNWDLYTCLTQMGERANQPA